MPQISVIVPVYNVEKYLNRCVESILSQTFKDFELLLIDDGSTDNSGSICDEYEKKDCRIKVIHKPNSGPSDARNVGIELAIGKYILFVDSDDWVSNDLLDFLYKLIVKNNADIALSGYISTGNTINNSLLRCKETHVISKENIRKFCLNKEIVSPCGKLYKRDLFNKIRFPSGQIYEDIFTVFQVMSESNSVVVNLTPKYYYFSDITSITRSKFTKSRWDLLKAYEDVLEACMNETEEVQKLAEFRRNKCYFTLLCHVAFYGFADDYKDKDKTVRYLLKNFRKHYFSLVKSNLIPFDRKVIMSAMYICFPGVNLVGKLMRKFKKG